MKNIFILSLLSILFALGNIHAQDENQPSKLDVLKTVVASGYMGDPEIALYENWKDIPCSEKSDSFCVKITYTPGNTGWGGIYWLNIPNDWCEGRNLSSDGYNEIVFYARGERGGELVEFKAGDVICPNNKQQKDSFRATLGNIRLTQNWKKYSIDIKGKNLSNVIGIFCWVASGKANINGLTFYLDDVFYMRDVH
jgi:hypothetical protein